MAPAPKYQQLPVLSENIKRRHVAVSDVSGDDNILQATATAASSGSQDLGSFDSQPFLDASALGLKKRLSQENLLIEADITSATGYDEWRTIKNPLHSSYLEQNTHQPVGKIKAWLPYTLRLPFLSLLFALSTCLALVVGLMAWVSAGRHGLGDDSNTSILFFGWRFTPTLVVVLFVILVTMLLNDARRTEVFARLSHPANVANASSTVLSIRGHWWTDIFDAMSLKRNGGLRSWVLLCAAIMNLVGSFILSPLSAAFLSVESIQISRNALFQGIPSIGNAAAAVSPNDETYFKTISALVVNLTTSVWLTDDYAVVPFWPTELQAPLGATVPTTAQSWTSNTTIFQAELYCTPMTMQNLEQGEDFSFQLISEDGCSMSIAVGVPENTTSLTGNSEAGRDDGPLENDVQEDVGQDFYPILNSGSFWLPASIGEYDFSSTLLNTFEFRNQTILTNVSTECQNRYIFAVNTAFNISFHYPQNWTLDVPLNASDISTDLATFQIDSYICSSRFMMANVSATLAVSSLNTTISFDQTDFNQSKVEIRPGDFNISAFEAAFYSDTWNKKLNTSYYGTWRGPSAPLGAEYNFDAQAMIDDPLLLMRAQQVEQRFFGEGLMSAFTKTAGLRPVVANGIITESKNRVVASFGIGITMAVLFLLTSLMIVLVFYYSRLSRRPLNLDGDPGSASAVASLLEDTSTRSHFHGLERLPALVIAGRLRDLNFQLQSHGLTARYDNTINQVQDMSKIDFSKDWRPFVLRGSGGLSLISGISLLIIALSVLFATSETRGIYQSGFVSLIKIDWKDGYITSLAPYAIIPTLIAVVARFWWIAVEETFKRLQPYVAMTKEAVQMSAGPALSYQRFSSAFTAVKAVRMKHWLLASICTGTVLMEAFTVGMSALFQRTDSKLTSHITLTRDLRLRDIPQIFFVDEPSDPDEGDTSTPEILQQLYGDSQVFLSWIYGAVIELSYNGSGLPWTQDDWSFVPANLNATASGPGVLLENESTNVTLGTSGLRGRLDCTNVDMSNTSNWLKTWDLTNTSAWNMSAVTAQERKFKTGFELGIGLEYPSFFLGSGPSNFSEGLWSTFFSNPSRVRCCANNSDGEPGLAALGYWAPVGQGAALNGAEGHAASDFEAQDQGPYNTILTNFTVTWVVGKPFADEWQVASAENYTDAQSFNGHYLWSEIPEVVSINCSPVIEFSNVTVVIELESEQVVDYAILSDPRIHDPAWSDYYLHHNNSGEDGDNVQYHIKDNVTVSYGYLFLDAMLGAADYARVGSTGRWGYFDEPINDRIFAFRQTGYNSDLMSFATFSLLGGNYSNMLDPEVLSDTSSAVFGKFFQHFVSEDSLSGGGRAYMPLNETLPGDFLPIVNRTTGNLTLYQDTNSSTIVSPTFGAILSRPVYKLEMSKVAVFLCLTILVYLGFITLLIAIGYRHHFKSLPRDMDTLASVIALLYDSPKLLKWVAEHGAEGENGRPGEVKAVLGHFQGAGGDVRWGIELVDDDDQDGKSYGRPSSSHAESEYELLNLQPQEVR